MRLYRVLPAGIVLSILLLSCGTSEEPVVELPPEPVAPDRDAQWVDGVPPDEALALHRAESLRNWTEGGPTSRYVFLSMPEFFRHATVARLGERRELPYDPSDAVSAATVTTSRGPMTLDAFVQASPLDGVIVVHEGRIVYESYPRMRHLDRHVLMSASKVFAGTLVAILEDRGLIDTTQPVETYIPELRSGWRGTPVRNVLDMASGMACLETDAGAYSDPATCYYQFEASLGWQPTTRGTPASTYDYVAMMRREREPGEAFEYSSVNTFLLAWMAEKVTGKRYNELLAEEIWTRIGAESDALLAVSSSGVPVVHAGISMRLRDLARFAMLFTPSWPAVSEEQIVSDAYLDKIQNDGRPEIFDAGAIGPALIERLGGEHPKHNSYQWDFVLDDGDFFKAGYGGQGLYISPYRDLVIAFVGTPDEELGENEMILAARQLATSGLFDPPATTE